MSKKYVAPVIHPGNAIAALKEYNDRLFLLLNLMPAVIKYIKENPSRTNPEFSKRLADTLEQNLAPVNEYRNAE